MSGLYEEILVTGGRLIMFARDDLKNGMLCETRSGKRYLWLYGALRAINFWQSSISINLTSDVSEELDIVRVGYPCFNDVHTIQSIFESDFGEILWEEQAKIISKKEAEEVLSRYMNRKITIEDV